MMRFLKRIIAVVLVCVLSTLNVCSLAYANSEDVYLRTEHYEENGIEYTISYRYIGENLSITVKTDQNKDIIEIKRDEKNCSITELEYEGKTFFGQKKYDEQVLYDGEIKENSGKDDVISEAYGSKTYEKLEKKYWYSKNSTSTTLKYKIGCVATYELDYNKLDSTYQSYLNKYISSINKCNSLVNKAITAMGVTYVEAAIDIILVLMVTVPAVAAAGMVVAILGGGVVFVNYIIDAYEYYEDIKHYYSVVKIKGKKL